MWLEKPRKNVIYSFAVKGVIAAAEINIKIKDLMVCIKTYILYITCKET